MMVGHGKGAGLARRAVDRRTEPLVAVRNLSTSRLTDVSFTIGAGEVLGVAALDGQGQRSLFYALAGLEKRLGGTVTVEGRPSQPATPRAALADGLSLLPEERKTEGILLSLSAASNIVLPVVDRISRGGFVWPKLERARAAEPARAVDMSPRYMGFRIGDLSGGNQQKALLARTMATGTRTLLLFDPTRGVDVGTKEAIYAAKGARPIPAPSRWTPARGKARRKAGQGPAMTEPSAARAQRSMRPWTHLATCWRCT